jgi:hypothetical protein
MSAVTIFRSTLPVRADSFVCLSASASVGPDGTYPSLTLYVNGVPVDSVQVDDVMRYTLEHMAYLATGEYEVELVAKNCGRGPGRAPTASVSALVP